MFAGIGLAQPVTYTPPPLKEEKKPKTAEPERDGSALAEQDAAGSTPQEPEEEENPFGPAEGDAAAEGAAEGEAPAEEDSPFE
jgi:hypothetical protein